eukprot:768742-Hanusia_phi.AAC.2
MARIRRKAAERADETRRHHDDTEKQVQLKEKPGNIPLDVQIPHCFLSNIGFQFFDNAPKFHIDSWNVDITLKPLLGIAFLDINRIERYGVIRRVRADSVEVFILYNKSTITEVLENLSMINDRRYHRFLQEIRESECFQSIYLDDVPVSDIVRVFHVTYPCISIPSAAATTLQDVTVIGWFFLETVQKKQICQIQRFKGFRLSSSMLDSYFTVAEHGNFDYFKITNVLCIIRQQLRQWLDKRCSTTWNPRKANRLSFDVAIQDFTAVLCLLRKVCLESSRVFCSALSNRCTWTLHSDLLETELFKVEIGVPLKNCPYRVGPARGCVYLEGPLHISIPLRETSSGITFKFSKIVRLSMTNSLIWDFPPSH